MKKQILIFAFTLTAALINGQEKLDEALSASLDRLIEARYQPNGPGATALVARKGVVIYKKSFGMADLELNVKMETEHVFRIGSLTKQFTAVAILQLVEAGKIKLDDDITRFIPDYPVAGKGITVENLLTHTSGIMDYTAMAGYEAGIAEHISPVDMIARFKNEPLRFAPGSRYSYSNSNYFLLGHIISQVSGKTYEKYLEDHIFVPAGMTHSFYAAENLIIPDRASGYSSDNGQTVNAPYISMTQPYEAGSVLSTVGDMFKWHQALLSNKLISQGSLKKAFSAFKLTNGDYANYGYGWKTGGIYDMSSVWHGGAITGFGTMQVYLPQEDILVLVFSNCDCNPPKDLAQVMAATVTGRIREYTPVQISSKSLREYEGVFENAKGQLRINTVIDNQLLSRVGRGRNVALKPFETDRFFVDQMQGIDFTRNKKGKITSMVTGHITGNETWTRTSKPFPPENGIDVDPRVLQTYVGKYEVSPRFVFSVAYENGRLFLLAPQQEKVEMFADTSNRFFLKVNDAQFEFVRKVSGEVEKAILHQGGRTADAAKVE